jgi:sec-independent protein translocase protein TatA
LNGSFLFCRPAAMEEFMEGLFQPLHILLIVGIALLLFGPGKFADLGKGLGEGIRNFKSAVKEEPKKDEEKKS